MVRSDLTLLTDEQLDSVAGGQSGQSSSATSGIVVPNNNFQNQQNFNQQLQSWKEEKVLVFD